MLLNGFEIVAVVSEDSGLPFEVFLKSSGISWKGAPGLWIKNESDYLKFEFSKELPFSLKEWVTINREVLTKHWKGELTDRETLNLLHRILLDK